MSGTGINSAPEVIYPYKCSGSHDPAYPPAECPECRAWVEKHYPGFSVEDASTPIDPPIPLKHGGFLTVQRWHVLKTADGRVICGGTNAEGVIGSVAYQLHRWGTAESPKPTANAADQSAEDAGCNCSRNMPYFHWSHARTCPLYVPMPQPVPSAPSPAGETASEPQKLGTCDNLAVMTPGHWPFTPHKKTAECSNFKPVAVPEPVPIEGADIVTIPVKDIGFMSDDYLRACKERGIVFAAPIAPAAESETEKVYRDYIGALRLAYPENPLALNVAKEVHDILRAKPSAEGDGWIAELRYGLKLVEHALADENVEHVAPWTRMRNWLNQRDVYNGDLQEHRVTLEVVKILLTLLPAPPSGQGEVR